MRKQILIIKFPIDYIKLKKKFRKPDKTRKCGNCQSAFTPLHQWHWSQGTCVQIPSSLICYFGQVNKLH